ncbi:MAG TPA: hypothetical protein VLH39_02975 [Magnetospirillaceae bacterium]|nr:hypothetical protein [Magnetospirillaceae bacterium]
MPPVMFAFSVFALPLAYLSVSAWFFVRRREEALARNYFFGIVLGLPCVLVHLLLYGIMPDTPGSYLLALRIWWERFLLPFALAIGAYRILSTYEDAVRSDAALRRFMAFLFGCFTVLETASVIRYAAAPSPYVLFFHPLLAISGILAAVYFLERSVTEAGIYAALWTAAAVLASFTFTFAAYLFEIRLEWLGGILSLVLLGAAAYKVRFLTR